MRHVILHNHLFKNAGTSVDTILQDNFGPRWQSREFPNVKGGNSDLIADWISGCPNAVAFSTHTLLGPLPRLDGVRVIPIVLLRNPVERIASAYRFERAQDAETRGALLAKAHGFAGYVHARLSVTGDRQCRDFQAHRLAALAPDAQGSEGNRACRAATQIAQDGILGLVSEFDDAMARLSDLLRPVYPDFAWKPVTANATSGNQAQAVSPQMRQVLEETNAGDMALLDHAHTLLLQAKAVARAPQVAGIA